jgi:dihydroorotate dehydrogenase (NAD+) catalytic subunit
MAAQPKPGGPAAEDIDLSVDLAGVRLANPTVTASGTCGYGLEYAPFVEIDALGAFTTKSVTPLPRKGNPPERVVETSSGMLNAIGLANVGLERFIAEKVPHLPQLGAPVFVNVAGHSLDEYVSVCAALDQLPEIAGLELNVSCPNVADGLHFGTDPARLEELVKAVRNVVRHSLLIVKLSPNVTDITETARAAIAGGAQVLSLVNTFVGMAIHLDKWTPMLANGSGGLSGSAIKPLAVHLVHRVYREVAGPAGVPIIGMGGVRAWHDAVEFALAGASAVGVGTALFSDPGCTVKIVEGLRRYLADRGLSRFSDLVGQLKMHPADRSLA